MKHYLGIDPGLTGALALIDNTGRMCELIDLPIKFKYTATNKKMRCINGAVLENILSSFIAEYGDIEAYLEDIHGRSGWNASIIFCLGESVGAIRTVIDLCDIPISLFTPAAWKKYFNLTSDKNEVREYAAKCFPEAKDYLMRKKDHDRAEALLIAKYGLKLALGELK